MIVATPLDAASRRISAISLNISSDHALPADLDLYVMIEDLQGVVHVLNLVDAQEVVPALLVEQVADLRLLGIVVEVGEEVLGHADLEEGEVADTGKLVITK